MVVVSNACSSALRRRCKPSIRRGGEGRYGLSAEVLRRATAGVGRGGCRDTGGGRYFPWVPEPRPCGSDRVDPGSRAARFLAAELGRRGPWRAAFGGRRRRRRPSSARRSLTTAGIRAGAACHAAARPGDAASAGQRRLRWRSGLRSSTSPAGMWVGMLAAHLELDLAVKRAVQHVSRPATPRARRTRPCRCSSARAATSECLQAAALHAQWARASEHPGPPCSASKL